VVRDLADGGFITTQSGVGGGFSLARPPRRSRLGERRGARSKASIAWPNVFEARRGLRLTPR